MRTLLPAQILFSILTVFCIVFDATLLFCVVLKRWKNELKGPFFYIVFMTSFGITSKICELFMVDSWALSDILEVSYQGYRDWIGEEVTLLFTFSYLGPLFLNWLMTFHRISIFFAPIKSASWFSEKNIFAYSSMISATILTWLLVPYFSDCTLNFNALTSRVESACAPGRHPITLFQNKYLIYVPLASMVVNSTMVLYLKISRKFWKPTGPVLVSSSHVKRENVMIRQAFFIGSYLSVYEILYLHLRLYPEHFESLPLEFQSISYDLRLFAIGSLNFIVYFVETKTTRNLVLSTLGWSKTNKIGVVPTIASRS
ncbi:hypothetical protein CRE_21250 [Caenorhabditis remanei]|uniref:Serpentine receptor class gamma n=1 Tax=Caenorhabditis remanei TaxID=31234 RepID=E3MF40_CAERE|nr:hypothetical protein CRE_21250 [Caenorhabditis remanei]